MVMYIEHKKIVERVILPVLVTIEGLLGVVIGSLKEIRRDGSGGDMEKITAIINQSENSAAGVKTIEADLKELLEKPDIKWRNIKQEG